MSWKKHFRTVNTTGTQSPVPSSNGESPKYSNWQSNLPEIYVGHPNRIERYSQYEQMDADSEINAALDILAEFCSQMNESNKTAFEVIYKEKPTDNEVKIIKEQLVEWNSLNEFNKRMYKLVRNVLKYGDQVLIRDPETFKLFWTEMNKVTKVVVNESNGKEPEQYFIKDIGVNLQSLSATAIAASDQYTANPQITGGAYIQPSQPYTGGGRFTHERNEMAINAEHIVHCSLTEGLDAFWPFGNSVLEHIFKVYKQKELLEDSIIIYRIQRAPERRVFKIDVGNMVPHMAMAFVERVKNEIHQRRIPSQCLALDTKIPLLDGRTITLEQMTLEYNQGKQNWVYSCNPESGNVVPGIVSWAGITRKDAKVLKLTLDNGKEITCTPDHKFPIIGKGFIEAKDLVIGESFIPGYFRQGKINNEEKKKYLEIFDPSLKEWKYVHRLVARYFKDKNDSVYFKSFDFNEKYKDDKKLTIHHLDLNKFNNAPDTFVWLSPRDHIVYHAHLNVQYYGYQNYSRQLTGKSFVRPKESVIEKYSIDDNMVLSVVKKVYQHLKDNIHYTQKSVGFKRFYPALQKDLDFIEIFSKSNQNSKKHRFGPGFVRDVIKKLGFSDFNDFKDKYEYLNHKLVKIEWIEETITTGTITVDKEEKYHNYHTFLLDSGIFTKNSGGGSIVDSTYSPIGQNEDFFFPTGMDGRGSSVEVLPGGQNLGEITDLRFFTNKLFRGLRIPSSYLPTETEDSNTAFNDGKATTSLIQEWRFNQYCKRLQSRICETFDHEFKMFMRWRGITIDSGMFEIKFPEPQNFAKYRQAELDTTAIGAFSSLEQVPYLSKRFILKRYLGLTEEEMQENEEMWNEEQSTGVKDKSDGADLRSVGVTPGGIASDLGNIEDMSAEEPGAEGGIEPAAGAAPGPGGAAAPAPPQ